MTVVLEIGFDMRIGSPNLPTALVLIVLETADAEAGAPSLNIVTVADEGDDWIFVVTVLVLDVETHIDHAGVDLMEVRQVVRRVL